MNYSTIKSTIALLGISLVMVFLLYVPTPAQAVRCDTSHLNPITPDPNDTISHPEVGNNNPADPNDPPPPLVLCGQFVDCRCELADFFEMLVRIFNFILLVGSAFAVFIIALGGVLILASGFNQNWYERGKKMVMGACIAVLLMFCSWLIINIILTAFGYTGAGTWSSLFGP